MRSLSTIIVFLVVIVIQGFFMFHATGQGLVINEFMSDNETCISDKNGEYTDWIELFNAGKDTLNIGGYSLTDNISNLNKWSFPEIMVPPKCHVLVFASGNDILTPPQYHTNFRISSDGEQLFLVDNKGIVIDQTISIDLSGDEVFMRETDGAEVWMKSKTPTPGYGNYTGTSLAFSQQTGFYSSPFYLTIESIYHDSIFYTLDGSNPDTESLLFTDSLYLDYSNNNPNYFSEIPSTAAQTLISYKAWEPAHENYDKATIVRCVSYRNGRKTSNIYTQSYFIDKDIFKRHNLPVISLVTQEENFFDPDSGIYVPGIYFDPKNPEWTGNFAQRGQAWERPVHLEYLQSNGKAGFSQDAGIRIHGAKTRQASQKSLKLYARKEYGSKSFNYPLLPQKNIEEYNRFVLTASMGGWWGNTVIQDVLANEIVKGLNFEQQDFQPVVVYLNGEYWGLYTLKDRIDDNFIGYTFGCDKDSIDLIGGNFKIVESGNNQHYIKLAEYIAQNDLSAELHYNYVCNQIDIQSFMDYMIAEMFFANKDWPRNNQKLWRPQTPDGKWRWIFYDLDAGFNDFRTNMVHRSLTGFSGDEWQNAPVSVFLFGNLIKNESFVN